MSAEAITTIDLATVRRHTPSHIVSDHARPRRYRGKRRHVNTDVRAFLILLALVLILLSVGAVALYVAGKVAGVW